MRKKPYGHTGYTYVSRTGKVVSVDPKGAKVSPDIAPKFIVAEPQTQATKLDLDLEKLINRVARKEKGKGKHVPLTAQELTALLNSGRFALLSAGRNPENPEDMKLTDEGVAERYQKLQERLVADGYTFTKCLGNYGSLEDSFLVMVHDTDHNYARTLGKDFRQDSVIFGEHGNYSAYYTTGPKADQRLCARGNSWRIVEPNEKYYTEVPHPDGTVTRFTLNIDWERLEHYLDKALKFFFRALRHKNRLHGGKADKMEPEDFDPKALKEGTKVEREHTTDRGIAQEIAMDHLAEDPKYYVKLREIETHKAFQKSVSHEQFVATVMTSPGRIHKNGSGRFGARDVTFPNGVRAILKQEMHSTDTFRGIAQNTMHLREVAAYLLDWKLLHFDVVPTTTLTVYKGIPASMQNWVQGFLAKELVPHVFDRDRDDWKELAVKLLMKVSVDQIRKVILFDLIVNNVDRHAKNCLFDTFSKRTWAIDNGLTFGPYFKLYNNVFHRYLFRHNLVLTPEERARLGGITRDQLEGVLHRYLPPSAIEQTYLRIQWVLEQPNLGFLVVSGGEDGKNDFPSYRDWFRDKLKEKPRNRVVARVNSMGNTAVTLP